MDIKVVHVTLKNATRKLTANARTVRSVISVQCLCQGGWPKRVKIEGEVSPTNQRDD